MAKAFLLISTKVGKEKETLKALGKVKEVQEAHLVTGPYDIVAVVEAETMEKLIIVITEQIFPRVDRTVTCFKISLN